MKISELLMLEGRKPRYPDLINAVKIAAKPKEDGTSLSVREIIALPNISQLLSNLDVKNPFDTVRNIIGYHTKDKPPSSRQALIDAVLEAAEIRKQDGNLLSVEEIAERPNIKNLINGLELKYPIPAVIYILKTDGAHLPPRPTKSLKPKIISNPKPVLTRDTNIDKLSSGAKIKTDQSQRNEALKNAIKKAIVDNNNKVSIQKIASNDLVKTFWPGQSDKDIQNKVIYFIRNNRSDFLARNTGSSPELIAAITAAYTNPDGSFNSDKQIAKDLEVRKHLPGLDDDAAHKRIRTLLNTEPLRTQLPKRREKEGPLSDIQLKQAIEFFLKGDPVSVIHKKIGRNYSTTIKTLRRYKETTKGGSEYYFNELLPTHLENRETLMGKSFSEEEFFSVLAADEALPRFQRNKQIPKPQGGRPYNVDGVSEQYKTVIEFYGDLWHANPEKFPTNDQIVKLTGLPAGDVRKKDSIREQVIRGHGYKFIVIWEKEWETKSRRLGTINRVRGAFNLNPIAQKDLDDWLRSATQVNTSKPPTAEK